MTAQNMGVCEEGGQHKFRMPEKRGCCGWTCELFHLFIERTWRLGQLTLLSMVIQVESAASHVLPCIPARCRGVSCSSKTTRLSGASTLR